MKTLNLKTGAILLALSACGQGAEPQSPLDVQETYWADYESKCARVMRIGRKGETHAHDTDPILWCMALREDCEPKCNEVPDRRAP